MDHLEVVRLIESHGGKVWEDGHVSSADAAHEPAILGWAGTNDS